MKLQIILESFRQNYYEPIKHVGNILVLKLSKPLKVDHLGKIHTTDIICYNYVTNRFSGGMQESNGDVKIPPDFAFVFTPGRAKDSTKTGVEGFVEWLNSKGYFSQHQIKTDTARFIPKLDTKEIPERVLPNRVTLEKENKFKTFKSFPSSDLQKSVILKHADRSEPNKIFGFMFETKSVTKKDNKGKIVTETYYEDRSGFFPFRALNTQVSWNIDSPQFQTVSAQLAAKMVFKKILDGVLYIWTADGAPGLYCGGLFRISGNKVHKLLVNDYIARHEVDDVIEYTGLKGGKLDLEDVDPDSSTKDLTKVHKDIANIDLEDVDPNSSTKDLTKVHKDIASLEPDSDEEIQAYLTQREKAKQEQAAFDAQLKASLAQSSLKKPETPKEKPRRKLEMD